MWLHTVFLLASDPTSPDLPAWIGTAVTPTLVTGAWLAGWIVTGRDLSRLEKQFDKVLDELQAEREKNAALQAGVIETAIPAITKNTALVETLTPLMQRIVYALDRGQQGPPPPPGGGSS